MEQEFNKAVEKFQSGQYRQAEKILLKINKRQPDIPDVGHMLAYIAMETDRPETAAKYLSKIVKSVPHDASLFNLLGCARRKEGKVDDAIEAFSKAVALAPEQVDARFNLAGALNKAGRLEEAADEFRRTAELAPEDANVHNELGRVLRDLKSDDQACLHFEKAISLKPGFTQALNNLGLVLLDRGQQDAALKAFSDALESDPDDAESHFNLGAVLAGRERLEEARKHLSRAVEINPEMTKAFYLLADVLRNMGKPEAAMPILTRALALAPDSHALHRLRGVLFQSLDQNEKALASYAQARRLKPDDTETLLALSGFLEKASKLEQASEAVEDGLKAAPDNFGLNLIAAKLAYRAGEFEKALGILLPLAADNDTPPDLQRDRYFELGRVYDRLEDAEKAYQSFANGNEAAARSWKPQDETKDRMVDYVNHHLDVVTEPWISTWTPAYDGRQDGPSPVFLIGFPRSGTTLLDQILDSHPGIQVLEEEPVIIKVRSFLAEQEGAYPETLAGLSSQDIARLRRLYFEIADTSIERKEGLLLIDKMPLNTVEAALIHRLFPDAKFIFSLRHPCDVCLSCFMQSFVLNAGMASFLTLEDTVNLYERVMTLWRHYQSRLPLSVFKIRYEDLIGDMEGTVQDLLAFLELPWDNAVLEYYRHAAKRNINTPSYSQVTQKIYTSARFRWLRYEKYFDPLLDRLQPFIDEFGYGKNA